jgi:hypothetical protein
MGKKMVKQFEYKIKFKEVVLAYLKELPQHKLVMTEETNDKYSSS